MVVVMKSNATDEEIDGVVSKVREAAGEAFVSRGKTRPMMVLVLPRDKPASRPLPQRGPPRPTSPGPRPG